MNNSPFFIYNPVSGDRSRAEQLRHIRESLGNRFPWMATALPGDITSLARKAAMEGAKTIVAVGGNGTVHDVVNGMMSVEAPLRPSLGILPIGTGNDFAQAARIPSDLEKALELVLNGKSHPVDLGSMENERGDKVYWANSCGIGLNGRAAIRAGRIQAFKGEMRYIAATLAEMMLFKAVKEADLTVDNHRLSEGFSLLTLGNGPREGGGFLMTPGASIEDGYLDLLFVGPLSMMGLLALLPSARKGTHLKSRAVFTRKFSTLHLKAYEPLAIHTDGEIFAAPSDNIREISIQVHPGAIRVIR
ncbi:MAG TPA: diacylglycerol kinase family protein [Candidatus Kapabacteria bacterium]|nr:diacylglycerol kinase family protein [Candidatus Kapabacteria bacterium]